MFKGGCNVLSEVVNVDDGVVSTFAAVYGARQLCPGIDSKRAKQSMSDSHMVI